MEQQDEEQRDLRYRRQEAGLAIDQARIKRDIEALKRELEEKNQLRETLESGEDRRRHRRHGFFEMVERKRSGDREEDGE